MVAIMETMNFAEGMALTEGRHRRVRKTYVWDKATRKLVPKGARRIPHMGVLPDIKDFQTTDGVNINGRAGLKEYEKRTGMEQIGNDSVNGLDEHGRLRRIIQEMPSARHDVIEAMKRHSS